MVRSPYPLRHPDARLIRQPTNDPPHSQPLKFLVRNAVTRYTRTLRVVEDRCAALWNMIDSGSKRDGMDMLIQAS